MDPRLGREAGLVALGQVGSALGLLAAVRLLTAVLSPSEYGVFVLGLTAATLASQTLLGPLANAAQRFYAAAEETDQLREFWIGVRVLGAAGSCSVLAVGLAGALVLHMTLDQGLGRLALACVAFAILSGCETILDAVQSAGRRRGVVAWHQILRQWLRPLFALSIISASGGRATAALVGYALASCFVLGSQLSLSRGLAHGVLNGWRSPYTNRLFHYAAPFATWGVFTWAHLASDRWALGLSAGPEVVAAYAVTFQLGAQPVYLLGAAAGQLLEPIVYARAGTGADSSRVRAAFYLNVRLASIGAGLLGVLVLTELAAHPLIFAVLAAPQYQTVSHLLALATTSASLFSLGQLIGLGSVVFASSRVLLAPKITSSVLGIALNVAGAYLFGIEGVLVAGVVTAILYCMWVILVSRSLLGDCR